VLAPGDVLGDALYPGDTALLLKPFTSKRLLGEVAGLLAT